MELTELTELMVLEDLELVLKLDMVILMLMAKVFKESQFNKPRPR